MGLLGTTTQNTYYGSGNSANYGNYQFVSLDDIVNGFMLIHVGEDKIINKCNRMEVQYHAMRGLQEFSYDILRSFKAQEIEVPNTLKMILPQDYVNYSKITRVDSNGIEKILYPTGKTSNPLAITQDAEGVYTFSTDGYRKISYEFLAGASIGDAAYFILNRTDDDSYVIQLDKNDSWDFAPVAAGSIRVRVDVSDSDTAAQVATKVATAVSSTGSFDTETDGAKVIITYKHIVSSYTEATNGTAFVGSPHRTIINAGGTETSDNLVPQSESDTWAKYKSNSNTTSTNQDYDALDHHNTDHRGRRYGLDPQHAQQNGTFYIDNSTGYIHFGSDLAGDTVVLHYISDGLGTDAEMVVHKFAEEAMYKWILYGIISSKSNMPNYVVERFKKERFAESRKAKIRLSNIKMEEFTQILRGINKPIK